MLKKYGCPSRKLQRWKTPLALEEMLRANTVEHKLNPQLSPDTGPPWPKCVWVLMTEETRHVKRHVADEICHDAVITDMDGTFASHVAQVRQHRSVPDSPTLPTSAPTPREVRQESARDKTVLTNTRKAHTAYHKFQRDLQSVIARSLDCSTTQSCTVERDLHTALVNWEKLDLAHTALETLAWKGDPLSERRQPRSWPSW